MRSRDRARPSIMRRGSAHIINSRDACTITWCEYYYLVQVDLYLAPTVIESQLQQLLDNTSFPLVSSRFTVSSWK